MPPDSGLSRLGIDPAEVEAYISLKADAPIAKQICICGHPISHHIDLGEGRLSCVNSTMYCPCVNKEAVLVVEDIRYFSRKTEGFGVKHALTRGLHELHKRGKLSKFIVTPCCKACGEETPPLLPTSVTPNLMASSKPAPHNVFLCGNCIAKLLIR